MSIQSNTVLITGASRGLGANFSKVLANEGFKKITIISPGFVTDCLETLDEIQNEAKEIFIENGGKKLNYVNCLNDSKEAMNLFEELILKNLGGWLENKKRKS